MSRAEEMDAVSHITFLADPDSFKEHDRGLVSIDPLAFVDNVPYRQRLSEARERTKLREAVVIGEGRMEGLPVILIAFEFGFIGGTMGSVAGEKVAKAFDLAIRRRLPVVSYTASGGARLQEGMLSLMQMAKTAEARARHDKAGLAYVSILGHPTFGGVAASFAALGDVLVAAPGSQIGFVGPRVIETMQNTVLPADSHRAETLLQAGLLDLVVPLDQMRHDVAYLIRHLSPEVPNRTPLPKLRRSARYRIRRGRAPRAPLSAWDEVTLARRTDRPTTRVYIEYLVRGFVELHGDRQSGDDPAIVAGLGELGGHTVMIIGQERGRTPEEQAKCRKGSAMPEGYRKALRLMNLAAKFHLPVLTFIDTPGAASGYDAESKGVWLALAQNLAAMAMLPTPTVAVLIGEGGSGGALALGVADRVLMLEHAFYSVISPEAAAAILHRDTTRATDVASALKSTAGDLRAMGIIDAIVPEPGAGAHTDPPAMAEMLRHHILGALRDLRRLRPPKLLRERWKRYRHVGRHSKYWREVVRGEMHDILGRLEAMVERRHARTVDDAPAAEGTE
ncbi:MAG TPA: acetyl-CoA carboxylase carboxyltransferase subunit alpha/beta [bacterium]|jgi:acetyl-CoA carboxylase carboxyl transferase subunit beta